MKRLTKVIALIGLALFLAHASFAQQVKTDHDRAANFSHYRRGFGGFGQATTTSDTYTVGTLVVDLFDAKTKNLVWRGVSSGMLSNR